MITKLDFGTILGPHVMRDGERPARLCTLCTRTNRPAYCPRPGKMGYHYLLGVKWSQVQILSARRRSEGGFDSPRSIFGRFDHRR
jgi:hypothetical protein